MSAVRQWLLLVVVAGGALLAGYVAWHRFGPDDAASPEDAQGGAILAAALPDMAGKAQQIGQWKGKVLVINFWATWCEPCREEIPAFIRVQSRLEPKGVQVVGIAIDQVDKVKPYAAQIGINYPILVGELDALDLTRRAGNKVGGLPYTVVFDRAGRVVAAQLGGITEDKLRNLLQPLL